MVSFIRKRLQVFVSSTYSDLIHERQAAVEAVLTAGHIPAGMELFTSGDESQMAVIKQWIDESDVYLLIFGGRYGSIERKTRKSYTQLEYEYAVAKKKPLFACVITEAALEEKVKARGTDAIEIENPQKLKTFRADVLTKMVRFWEDAKDIKITVGETLSHFSRRDDLTGWIRASDEANTPALADEIARLSKENSVLRTQLASGTNDKAILGISYGQMKEILEQKDLLGYLVTHRMKLVGWMMAKEEAEKANLLELTMLGLIRTQDHIYFNMTDEGRTFLNRFEADQLTKHTVDNNDSL